MTRNAAPVLPTDISPAYAVSCSFCYADEINRKKTGTYPADAVITLRELLRFDFLVFLGYLYDPESAEPVRQVAFANELLDIKLTTQQFFSFRSENSLDPDLLKKVPDSLKYFVKDDLSPQSRRTESGVSISRFLVNTFRDLGLEYIAYGGVSDLEVQRLTDYINMLNDFLKSYDLYYAHDPLRMGGKGDPNYGMPRVQQAMPDATVDMTVAASYFVEDEKPVVHTVLEGIDYPEAPEKYRNGIDMPGYKEKPKNFGSPAEDKGTRGNAAIRRAEEEDLSPVLNKDEKQEDKEAPKGRIERRQAEAEQQISAPSQSSVEDLMEELDRLIGLKAVKKNLNNLINVIRIRKLREKMGLAKAEMSLHMVFSGNPGTGKTTVARLLARIYKALGVVSKGQLVEVDRAGLVEGYVGQTAQKTQEVIDSAMGGILFIDEAYTLTNKKENGDFGQEAVDTLLKRMEDDRDSFVVIAAGYSGPMEEFLQSNPGLRSRFSKVIEFEDYTESELYAIFSKMCSEQDYSLTEEADQHVKDHFHNLVENKEEHFANAREVRNFFERCIERQSSRLVEEQSMDLKDITTFTLPDVTE